jgi:hypothetical protein
MRMVSDMVGQGRNQLVILMKITEGHMVTKSTLPME